MIPYVSAQGNPQNGKPSLSPAQTKRQSNSSDPPLYFDAKFVARKDEGWQEMLEKAVLRWVSAVVDEKRGER